MNTEEKDPDWKRHKMEPTEVQLDQCLSCGRFAVAPTTNSCMACGWNQDELITKALKTHTFPPY